jgi:hypothetical protein
MTKTIPAHAGRIAGRVWLALQQVDWQEVGRIVLHGLVAAAVLTYMAGHALGTAVHALNGWLSARWVALLVKPEVTVKESLTVEPEAPAAEPVSPADELVELSGNSGQLAPPAVAPLFEDLAHLSVRQLRELTGVRSKRFRRAELLAMVAA